MATTLHRANTRGIANHGWLQSHHTFSFAGYFNPNRMGFGTLRVINDDIVAPSRGFGTHPHENMEIISIPLRGALKHQDTMGNHFVIGKGDVQAMTAGTGVAHSEFNHSSEEEVNFLQIWVLPKKKQAKPSYSQKTFSEEARLNQWQLIVSPDGQKESVHINQDAFFSLLNLKSGKELSYSKYRQENGVYFFVLDGEIQINQQTLYPRDGLGIENEGPLHVSAKENAELLVMEVPMGVS